MRGSRVSHCMEGPMTLRSIAVAALVLAACSKDPGPAAGANVTLNTDDEKTLYALGLSVGRSITLFDLSPQELAIVQKGMGDQVSGQKPQVELETWGPKIQ